MIFGERRVQALPVTRGAGRDAADQVAGSRDEHEIVGSGFARAAQFELLVGGQRTVPE
jgi:hypothetical protein